MDSSRMKGVSYLGALNGATPVFLIHMPGPMACAAISINVGSVDEEDMPSAKRGVVIKESKKLFMIHVRLV